MSKKISKEMKQLLKKSQVMRDELADVLSIKDKGGKPIVATWGLMNAGKSYLLNMLTEHIDDEYFKVNDIRETATLKECEMGECIFLDTPGLDANHADNMQALKGAAKADVVLFVHQLQGELEAVEIEFLQELRASFDEYASENIIMIFSKIDKESQDKVDQIQSRVLEQCQEYLGFSPVCFQVSNTRYKKGVQEHKDGMVRASHIDELKQHLYQNALSNVKKVRMTRQVSAIRAITEELAVMDQEIRKYQAQIAEPTIEAFRQAGKLMKKEIMPALQKYQERYEEI